MKKSVSTAIVFILSCSRLSNLFGKEGIEISVTKKIISDSTIEQVKTIIFKYPEIETSYFDQFYNCNICNSFSYLISKLETFVQKTENKKFATDQVDNFFKNLSYVLGAAGTFEKLKICKDVCSKNGFYEVMGYMEECPCSEFNRWKSTIRAFVEDDILNYMEKKFNEKTKEIVITDLASGKLFTIFIMINRIFAAGYKKIRLNLIDLNYKDLISRIIELDEMHHGLKAVVSNEIRHSNTQPSHKATAGYSPYIPSLKTEGFTATANKSKNIKINYDEPYITDADLKTLYEDFNKFSAKDFDGKGSDFKKRSGILSDLFILNNGFFQFLNWFSNIGFSDLKVNIYSDASSYLEDIKEKENEKSDILLTVDNPMIIDLIDDFNLLRKDGLNENGFAVQLAKYWTGLDKESNGIFDLFYLRGNSKKLDYYDANELLKNPNAKPDPKVQEKIEKAIKSASNQNVGFMNKIYNFFVNFKNQVRNLIIK